MRTRKLILCALLCAVALGIFVLEAQIPLPVPGMKLGLSNVVTLFALPALGSLPALALTVVRILLGNLVTGQVSALLYAFGGALLSLPCMAITVRLCKPKQLWLAGVLGGLAHNLGQMAVAVVVTETPALLVYLPLLLLFGLFSGAFTGICAQLLVTRYQKFKEDFHR